MTRRTHQQGRVYQKGRKRTDPWLPKALALVQFYRDVPGEGRRHEALCLGVCRTRAIAERIAAEKLVELGINSTQTFIEATSNITFRQQAEIWLKSLETDRREPLADNTLNTRRGALDKWMYPFFGDTLIANIHNVKLREFVNHLVKNKLSAATIRDYVNIMKPIVASAIDKRGEPLFPRTWKEDVINRPSVRHQKQPSVNKEGMEAILKVVEEPYRLLFQLLAGCGPMRAGEALGLEIDKHISKDFRTLYIRQKAIRGRIEHFTKTESGTELECEDGEIIGRDIDLSKDLAGRLRAFVGNRRSGLVFCKENGEQLMQRDILKYGLHPTLKKLGFTKGGLNIFRRFRITRLKKTVDCPDALKHFWSGHAQTHVSERYTSLLQERDFRLEWAEKIGTGFDLPKAPISNLGNLVEFRRVG